MQSDPIADMLTRIRNANIVKREKVELPGSRLKKGIAQILKDEGFIRDYEWISDGKQGILRIYMKYGAQKERVITGLRMISKPGRRVYVKSSELRPVLGGLGIAILSTSRGLMTDKAARENGIGGELICEVW